MNTLQEALSVKWRKRDGSIDTKMVDYCIKSSIYIQIGDMWVNCGSAKPRIESQMWYDDETDGPDASKFTAFRAYNLRSNEQPMLSTTSEYGGVREVWLAKNYYGDNDSNLMSVIVKRVDDLPRSGELRQVTVDELELINAARARANADYEKRLVSYWKRYSDKVHASGYWANR